MKILITDSLPEQGLAVLRQDAEMQVDVRTKTPYDELLSIIPDYHALIIRSATTVTADVLACARNLKVIGRAGVGLDNIDVDEATRRGIIVTNAPEGNTTSTCELTMGMIMAVCRRVAEAATSMKRGEWKRSAFTGTELSGKTLGIVGLGRIGAEVARRAAAFGMKLIGYDPFCTLERAAKLNVTLMELDELLAAADIITLHVPLTDETRNLIDAREFGLMKDGVKLINCARGGIVNENALYDALTSGKVSGCGLDVFEQEPPGDNPLLKLDNVVAIPHLGAATVEAKENVAIEIARNVLDALHGRPMKHAANLPKSDTEAAEGIKPYVDLAEKLGKLLVQAIDTIGDSVSITTHGEINNYDLTPVTRAFLCGLFKPVLVEQVNMVNASAIAQERGLDVVEAKSSVAKDYTSLITVETIMGGRRSSFSGTMFALSEPRVVRIDDMDVDVIPEGPMLICRNDDKPGAISHIANVLAKRGVNIARMTVGRDTPGGRAIIVLNIDEPVTEDAVREILALPIIKDVRVALL